MLEAADCSETFPMFQTHGVTSRRPKLITHLSISNPFLFSLSPTNEVNHCLSNRPLAVVLTNADAAQAIVLPPIGPHTGYDYDI